MNSHEELHEQLPDFVAGNLPHSDVPAVEAHLVSCGECSAFVRTLRDLGAGFQAGGEELLTPHPKPTTLLALAHGTSTDPAAARHVETCATCSLEVAFHADSKPAAKVLNFQRRDAKLAAPLGQRRRFAVPAYLAAGLVTGIGLTLLYHPPSTTSGSDGSRPNWTGSVGLVALEPPLRGDGPVPSFVVSPGQPYVPVAVPAKVPEGSADTDRYVFEIQDAAGRSSWKLEMPAADIRAQVKATGVTTFLIPADTLGTGAHVFTERDSADDTLLRIPFESRR